jgi:type IV secretion system protein VirB6
MLTPVLLAQATDINLFRHIDRAMEGAFASFLNPAVTNIISALQTTALVGGTLYILIVGLSIVLGGESTPFYTFLRTAGKIALVSAFSLSADGYLGGLVAALKGLDSGLVQALRLDFGFLTPAGSVVEQIDQMLSVGFDKFAQCLQQANTQGVFSPGAAISWAIAGLLFGISTAALAIFGGAIVLLTKFALTILFAMGPLFVLGLMFPQTSGFFDKWLGEVLSFIFQNVIVSTVLSFAMVLFLSFLAQAEIKGDDATNPFVAGMQVLVAAFVMVYFLWKSGPIAAGLSGGMGASIVDAVGAAGMSRPLVPLA